MSRWNTPSTRLSSQSQNCPQGSLERQAGIGLGINDLLNPATNAPTLSNWPRDGTDGVKQNARRMPNLRPTTLMTRNSSRGRYPNSSSRSSATFPTSGASSLTSLSASPPPPLLATRDLRVSTSSRVYTSQPRVERGIDVDEDRIWLDQEELVLDRPRLMRRTSTNSMRASQPCSSSSSSSSSSQFQVTPRPHQRIRGGLPSYPSSDIVGVGERGTDFSTFDSPIEATFRDLYDDPMASQVVLSRRGESISIPSRNLRSATSMYNIPRGMPRAAGSAAGDGLPSPTLHRYRCSECRKTFDRASSLNTHHLSHTGDRPFKCLDCGQAFTTHSNCTRHERTFHPDSTRR